MNRVRRIASNTISLSIGEIIVKIVLFFIFVYIARQFGNVIFGRFNFAYSFSLIAVIFADIGINYMIVREISRKKDLLNKFISNSFFIKSTLFIIVFILTVLILRTLNYPPETQILAYLLLIYMFLRSNTELLYSVFKAFERMHYEALIKSVGIVSILIFSIFGLWLKNNVIILGLVFVFVQFITLIVTYIVVNKKFVKLKLEIEFKFVKKIIMLALPFTLSMIFAAIYFHIDNIMLSLFKGDVPVGIYSASYNITMAILFIPGMYIFSIYPILSSNYKKHKKKVRFIYERSFKYLYMLGLPISVGLYLIARNIILFIYGTNYSSSILVLKILAWFILFKFVSYLTGIILSSIDKQKYRMYSQGVAAFLNLGLNFILIPKFSYIGAGISTIISEIVLLILTFYFVSKYFHFFNILKILYKPIIASVFMTLSIIFLNLNMFILIFIGAIVYFSALFLLKSFDERDFSLMRTLLKIK